MSTHGILRGGRPMRQQASCPQRTRPIGERGSARSIGRLARCSADARCESMQQKDYTMKKMQSRNRLALRHETVRSLDRVSLTNAAGAKPKATGSCNDCPPTPGGGGGGGGSDSYGFDCQTRNFCW